MTDDIGAKFYIALTYQFHASPDAVFDQWLSAEAIADWFAPGDYEVTAAQADPREGGAWQVRYLAPNGTEITESGTYQSIERPRALSITLSQDIAGGAKKSRVDVEFEPNEIGTLMRFRQTGLTSAAQRDGMAEGWRSCFDKLAEAAARQEVRETFEAWFAASEAKDLDASMAPIAEDIVSYEHTAPLEVRDISAMRRECAKGFAQAGPEFRWDIPDHTIIVRGDLAVAYGLNRMVSRENGKVTSEMWSRGTRVLRRRDGRWRMIHQHVSFPIDGETGEVRLDLVPEQDGAV